LLENISVIIRNRNEERWIGHCIQSCLENFHSPEIIVINHKSEDESIDIVNSFRHDPSLKPAFKNYCDVKTIAIDEYSPGRSINLGVKHAANEYICILSAHSVIQKIDSIFLSSSLKKYPCVFGKQIPIYRGKKITPRYIWSHFKDEDVINMYSELEGRYFLHNAFSFYQKNVLLDLPFDENLTTKEDRIWALALINSGKSFFYSPKFLAHHHYTSDGNTWKGIA